MEVLQPKMDKHMMLLDGKVLKGDHSFKFAKHMAKIEDSSVFSALYTMTNEYEEIVHQALVPSKSLSYLKHSFEIMQKAYSDYGYNMPVAFFIDNVTGDKAFLEGIFHSLKDNIQPLEDQEISFLRSKDELALTENVKFEYICREEMEIDVKIKELIERIRDSASELVIGFDAEWVVTPDKFLVGVMKIAFEKTLFMYYIFPDLGFLCKGI